MKRVLPVLLALVVSVGCGHRTSRFQVLEVSATLPEEQAVFVSGLAMAAYTGSEAVSIQMVPEGERWLLPVEFAPGSESLPRYTVGPSTISRLGDVAARTELPPGEPIIAEGSASRKSSKPVITAGAAQMESFLFTPSGFKERQVRVRLPANYDAAGKKLPLLLALDGQNVFSPGGPFGSWDLDLIIDEMIAAGEIPAVIVAAIDNTDERFAEYIPNWGTLMNVQGRGNDFLDAVQEELLPALRGRYAIAEGPEAVTLVGASLGGLIGFEAAHHYRDSFGAVIAMSPSFMVNPEQTLTMAQRGPEERVRLWMDSGTAGRSYDGYSLTFERRNAMLLNGAFLGYHFMHVVGIDQQHNEAAWKERSPAALRWAYARP